MHHYVPFIRLSKCYRKKDKVAKSSNDKTKSNRLAYNQKNKFYMFFKKINK
jgi:hypothetical protein